MEGVVKYNFKHQDCAIDENIDLTELYKIRKNLFDKKLIGMDEFGVGYGNMSVRLQHGSKEFIITGSQTGKKRTMSRNDFCIVSDYDFENFFLESHGITPPSSEALTHAAIYNLYLEVQAVIHIHSDEFWTFMLKNNFLKTEKVEYGTLAMVNEIKRLFQKSESFSGNIFAMAGHTGGIIAFGENLVEAYNFIDFHLIQK